MKSVGLVVEYNPFHNGHLYHLTKSKALVEADVVIVVMSGHFTQRGEPTVVNKWLRTEMALFNGADLVVELPYAYSVQHASLFAHGAISILEHLKVDEVVFGSECGEIDILKSHQAFIQSEAYQQAFQSFLSTGDSVPRASEKALQQLMQHQSFKAAPNDTLGLHYLNAIDQLQANIIPKTIQRIHSHYHETAPVHDAIASATSVRALRQAHESITSYVPKTVATSLAQDESITGVYHDFEAYFPMLKQKILTLTPFHLVQIHDMEEGLEYRLYDAMMKSQSFDEFMNHVKTKRYTRTRIQRICAHILTHTTKDYIASLHLSKPAPYVRILGTTQAGRHYLKQIKKEVTVPIYSKFSSKAHPMLLHEQAVTAAYSAILPEPHCASLNKREYLQFPLHIDRISL